MSYIASWVHTPIAQALGWTLVHFVWEGAVLAAMLLGMLWLLRGEPARRRYSVACAILAMMPVAFAITLAVIWAQRPMGIAMPIRWVQVPASAGALSVPAQGFSWRAILDRLAWLVPVWFAGVAIFYARGLAGWAAVRRMRRRGVCAAPAEWRARLEELAARVRISRPVVLLESCLTDTPVLIGYLRPVILLPVGCLTGLPLAQVECILLHELAHVARHDYVVNLLQSLVEGLLFYHPAVWWVSGVVRAERENCCDDRVVELMGNARAYAATLAVLEQRRALAFENALAASGGNLMKRIRRLTMEPRGAQVSVAPAFSAALLLAVFAAALTALPVQLPRARKPRTASAPAGVATFAVAAAAPQRSAANQATPYRKWLDEDVVYIITDQERAAFLALTTDAEREEFIEQFWKRRDPTPDTEPNEYREEHYRRIAYANEHFAGSMAGWKTDRGRIYITYGPPDEIDHHPDEAGNRYAFEKWRYRSIDGIGSNVVMDFVDRDGTGDFPMTKDPAGKEKPAYRKWLNEDAAYIITPADRAAFQRLTTDEERDEFIQQFWQQRGPAAREEHYRRIAYANEHFASGIPGWKTDCGRIYITYGPPDAIQNGNAQTIEWTYRHIDSIGNNVTVDFQDSQGNGEFHMTKDPAQGRDAKVVEADDHAPVLVTAAGNGQQLTVLRAEENTLKAALRTSVEQLRDLEQNLERSTQELKVAQEAVASNAEVRRKSDQLLAEAQQAKAEYLRAAAQQPDGDRAKQAKEQLDAKNGKLAKFVAVNHRVLLDRSQAGTLDVQTRQSIVADGSRKIEIAKQRLAMLESSLNVNHEAQIQALQANPATPTVEDIQSVGPASEQSMSKRVHLLVPLSPTGGKFRVLGQVTSHNHIVQSFQNDVSGGPSTTVSFSLRPGTYHVTMVVKDMASGTSRTIEYDFTVL